MSYPPFFWKSYEQYVGSWKNVHIKLTQQNTNNSNMKYRSVLYKGSFCLFNDISKEANDFEKTGSIKLPKQYGNA